MVNSERQFHRHYRDLASSWLEEICKPSRRFKKMTAEELDIPKKSGVKKAVPTRSQRNDDKGDIFADSENEDEEDELSDEKQKVNDQKK